MSEGVVYDLGYRPHEGDRLGRAGALRALYRDGLRRVPRRRQGLRQGDLQPGVRGLGGKGFPGQGLCLRGKEPLFDPVGQPVEVFPEFEPEMAVSDLHARRREPPKLVRILDQPVVEG